MLLCGAMQGSWHKLATRGKGRAGVRDTSRLGSQVLRRGAGGGVRCVYGFAGKS